MLLLDDTSSEPRALLSTYEPVRCEATTLPPSGLEFGPDGRYDRDAGRPLVYCAITSGVAVSFPSERVWNGDRVTVVFDELFRDGDIERVRKEVDNLSRFEDAGPIGDRCRESLEFPRSSAEVWRRRNEMFPNLLFGMDVEGNLKQQLGLLSTVVNCLRELDDVAREWKKSGGGSPLWTGVTPESESTMNDPSLSKVRWFRSADGEQRLFEWHARIGSGMRIHLRFAPRTLDIEIGYIGPKPPTKKK